MFQDALKRAREAKGMSQKELARRIGVSQSTVGMWESGKNRPEMRNLERIASALDVPMGELLADTPQARRRGVRVPVLGTVPAGIPIEAIEDVLGWEEISEDMLHTGQEYVCIMVRGESMFPDYHDGDILLIRLQPTADTGDDAIVFINGDEATFKRITRQRDGMFLRPLNPEFDPMFYSNREIEELPVRVFGVAMEVRRKLK